MAEVRHSRSHAIAGLTMGLGAGLVMLGTLLPGTPCRGGRVPARPLGCRSASSPRTASIGFGGPFRTYIDAHRRVGAGSWGSPWSSPRCRTSGPVWRVAALIGAGRRPRSSPSCSGCCVLDRSTCSGGRRGSPTRRRSSSRLRRRDARRGRRPLRAHRRLRGRGARRASCRPSTPTGRQGLTAPAATASRPAGTRPRQPPPHPLLGRREVDRRAAGPPRGPLASARERRRDGPSTTGGWQIDVQGPGAAGVRCAGGRPGRARRARRAAGPRRRPGSCSSSVDDGWTRVVWGGRRRARPVAAASATRSGSTARGRALSADSAPACTPLAGAVADAVGARRPPGARRHHLPDPRAGHRVPGAGHPRRRPPAVDRPRPGRAVAVLAHEMPVCRGPARAGRGARPARGRRPHQRSHHPHPDPVVTADALAIEQADDPAWATTARATSSPATGCGARPRRRWAGPG